MQCSSHNRLTSSTQTNDIENTSQNEQKTSHSSCKKKTTPQKTPTQINPNEMKIKN